VHAPEGLGELFVEAAGGTVIPLSEVAEISQSEGPAQVRREGLQRTVRVEVNLRGRDLVSWVHDAQAQVAEKVKVPSGYEITWGGQFENFERARARLSMVVPVALAIIFGMLLWMFGDARLALSVFAIVPFALTGGILGLVARGLSFSIPAAVGFIALAGVAVLNGVVITNEVRSKVASGWPIGEAVRDGSVHTARAVLTTGAVAALGFLPMAIATGAGAEVQRPLATVVVSGIAFSTVLTMYILPGLLELFLKKTRRELGASASPPPGSRPRAHAEFLMNRSSTRDGGYAQD
jgi:cobalt-zinc-cadmium resistance protein CzcA